MIRFIIEFWVCCRPMSDSIKTQPIAQRFRGFLPIVVDVETGGFNSDTDALLEIAAVIPSMNEKGYLQVSETIHRHVEPFEGANLDPAALAFTGIDPFHPLRLAVKEHDALASIFKVIRNAIKDNECTRAILVGHNAFFDLRFVNAAAERSNIKRNPFHPFSNFDTVSLAGMAYGQTVLARAAKAAGLDWNDSEAHSALYDAERTAQLFCTIVNRWKELQPPGDFPN